MFSDRKPDTLLSRLQTVLKDEKMLAQIRKNEGSRLFDNMPPEFDQVFSDLDLEAPQLAKILRNIPTSNIMMTDKGIILTKEADKAAIKLWAKRIMAAACRELLNEKNDIRPELLALLAKKQSSFFDNGPNTISSQILILAYFSIGFQYIGTRLNALDDANYINHNAWQACSLLVNQAKNWVNEVLKERLQPVKPSYLDTVQPSADAINDDLLLGIGGALFGLFALGGAAAAYALCRKKQDNQPSPRNSSDEDHSRSSSPDDFYYF